MSTASRPLLLALAASLALAGCRSDDPPASPDGAPRPDATIADAGPDAADVDADPGCQALASDYTPRDNGSAGDPWPACISDDNAYHPFNASISSIARVAAFEDMATLLFTGSPPSPQDFLDARALYLQASGLESRVSRREDEHYPPVTDGGGNVVACQNLTPTEVAANPERCVGPAVLAPIINDAFTVGQDGASTDLQRRIAAAQIEGALLWFFYVSNHKEATTCTTAAGDCDSSFAYYTGGDARDAGKGLARYVRALDVDTHDRIWDGILAVRCWRDLDNPTGVATDLTTRDLAIAQQDRASLRGVAQIVRDRTQTLAGLAAGDARTALWEMIRTLGAALDREATARDAATAALLRTELARTDVALVDTTQIITALDTIFPCS
ncbi:MAG: hypothetical protein H6708_34020 [Kofleriaceae bacterium]|nr:hypothetical protein [Myxococcales bacterium]MCB9565432.1 hypothetical protein [Kofleriaceae bacterium]